MPPQWSRWVHKCDMIITDNTYNCTLAGILWIIKESQGEWIKFLYFVDRLSSIPGGYIDVQSIVITICFHRQQIFACFHLPFQQRSQRSYLYNLHGVEASGETKHFRKYPWIGLEFEHLFREICYSNFENKSSQQLLLK